jgi:hypothetical protein
MPAYVALPTYNPGDFWTIGEGNKVGGDLAAIWNYLKANASFADNFTATNSTTTIYAVHSAIAPAAPAESFWMNVLVFGRVYNDTGSPSWFSPRIFDHTGADITVEAPGTLGSAVVVTASSMTTTRGQSVSLMGRRQYAAGVNPGISFKAWTDTGTVDFTAATQVTFWPA